MKLFISDLDGTLLDKVTGVGERNLAALQRLKDLGYTIVIATGRPFSSIQMFSLQHLAPYAITLNGSQIYTPDEQLCYQAPLSQSQASGIYSYCEEQNITYIVYTEVALYLYRPRKFMNIIYQMAKQRAHNEEELIDNLQEVFNHNANLPIFDHAARERITQGLETVFKIEICHYDQEVFEKLENQLDDSLSISASWPTNREITCANIHKGSALEKLCELLDCSTQDCIAIGDSRNDVEILQTAGFSIAMDNASDTIKEQCDYVSSRCEDSGVAEAIDYILSI